MRLLTLNAQRRKETCRKSQAWCHLNNLTPSPSGRQHLPDIGEQLPPVLCMGHGLRPDAGDLRAHLALVLALPRPEDQLQWLPEVALPELSLQALLRVQHLDLVAGEAQDSLRGLMEGGEPGAIFVVHEATSGEQAHLCLRLAAAGGTETALVHALVARQRLAVRPFPLLTASAIPQGQGLVLLPELYCLETRRASVDLRLRAGDRVRGPAHRTKAHRLGVCRESAAAPAPHGGRDLRDPLRRAAL